MKIKNILFLIILILSLNYCGSSGKKSYSSDYKIDINTYFSKEFDINKRNVYVILPFEAQVGWLLKANEANKRQKIENRNAEKLEIAIMNSGGIIVERERVNKLLKEMNFSSSGLTQETGIKIGKMLNANIVLFGKLPDYGVVKGNGITEIIIKAVDIESGQILWKAMMNGTVIKKTQDYELSQLENAIYQELGYKMKNAALVR